MKSSPTAVSLFSGGGGLDLGLKQAGFEFLLHVDQDEDSCKTLRANGFSHIRCDAVAEQPVVKEIAGRQVDIVVGGPPCQPFSKSSQWNSAGAKGLSDVRAETLIQFALIVNALRPRAFLLENVPQFAKLGGVQKVIEQVSSDYTIHTRILNSSHYGVPQNRTRLFMVGVLGDIPFSYPSPDDAETRCCWDYLEDMEEPLEPRLTGKWAGLIPSIPAGKNYLFHTRKGEGENLFGWRTRFWSFLYKLDPLGVSPTIVANPAQNNGPYHWNNRELSAMELAALQSFPRNYRFEGDAASVRRQIGNAVPPVLAEHLGRALMGSLGKPPLEPVKLLRERARSEPRLLPPGPIPDEFRSCVGEHADHPGHGKGPRPRVAVEHQ